MKDPNPPFKAATVAVFVFYTLFIGVVVAAFLATPPSNGGLRTGLAIFGGFLVCLLVYLVYTFRRR